VDGDAVYALGGQGELVCVEAATGKRRWGVNMEHDLGGQMMSGWGYTESPLVDGDHLVCTPGGGQGTLAALDKKTGKVVWRSKDLIEPAAYSSIVVGTMDGVRQYVQLTPGGVVGVAADDGRLLWRSRVAVNGTATIPTAVVHGDYVYATSGYGAGCALLKLTPEGQAVRAETVYANKEMENHHGGVVLVDGHIYGYSDRNGWVCQDFPTGKLVWSERRKLGKGSVTYADGHLYCYTEDNGTVALVRATTSGWTEDGRFEIPRHTKRPRKSGLVWTHPVIADGRLYLRDQDLIFCFDIKGGDRAAEAAPAATVLDQEGAGEEPPGSGFLAWAGLGGSGPRPWLPFVLTGGPVFLALLVTVLAVRDVRRRRSRLPRVG
jgi:outer membrane protein assembly factor BamB